MRIAESNISLAAEYRRERVERSVASARIWREPPPQRAPVAGASESGRDSDCGDDQDRELDPIAGDLRLTLLRMLVERLSGRRIDVLDAGDFAPTSDAPEIPTAAGAAAPAPHDPHGELAIQIDVETTRHERETSIFDASGRVVTGDGRTIDFVVGIAMDRERLEHAELHLSLGAAAKRKDPLVLSLDGRPPQLTADNVDFDIDADGTADRISFVAPGAAFLALDRNANGTIDDGSELFGARTGDGFGELRALDTDRDGWLDEDDIPWDQLQLLEQARDGARTQRSLRDAGIGAIYTGSAATPFTLAGGEVRSSGVYLTEQGAAGVVQQIDLFA